MRFLVLLALLGTAACVSYEGYKVYEIRPTTDKQMERLVALSHNRNFDFWSKVNRVGHPVTVMVNPKTQAGFESFLQLYHYPHIVKIENVAKMVALEKLKNMVRPKAPQGKITFDQYYRHGEINAYLNELTTTHPELVTVETIGQTYEGRDMLAIRISTTPGSDTKPKIFVDGGIHAREWIAPALALYIISELVENPANAAMLENVDWVVVPSMNPDGYEYSQTTDRFWRKTRSIGTQCDGVDPNRNFDFHWMESGASDWECDETYAGPTPFSEIECGNLRDYLLSLTNVKMYLTLHSYGQYLLYPWGYNSDLPPNWQELDTLGNSVADAIRAVAGTDYTVGSSTNVLYAAAGASDDWSMGVAGVQLVYTIELPGGGFMGFDLPPEEILPVCLETWEGIKVYHDYVAAGGGK